MARSRGFVFTLNNYSSQHESTLQAFDCTYLVYGREVAPKTGTPHLQGYMYMPLQLSLSALKKRIGIDSIHLECAVASALANAKYCTKEGKAFEKGTQPTHNAKVAITEFEQCKSFGQIQFVKFNKCREVLPRSSKTRVVWIYGDPGSGKSHLAWTKYPKAYPKNPKTKWWNNYYGQKTVIIDDYRLNDHLDLQTLLNLFDQYPMEVENKGGDVQFNSRRLVVTCPYPPWEFFSELDGIQILRRIDRLVHCFWKDNARQQLSTFPSSLFARGARSWTLLQQRSAGG